MQKKKKINKLKINIKKTKKNKKPTQSAIRHWLAQAICFQKPGQQVHIGNETAREKIRSPNVGKKSKRKLSGRQRVNKVTGKPGSSISSIRKIRQN